MVQNPTLVAIILVAYTLPIGAKIFDLEQPGKVIPSTHRYIY